MSEDSLKRSIVEFIGLPDKSYDEVIHQFVSMVCENKVWFATPYTIHILHDMENNPYIMVDDGIDTVYIEYDEVTKTFSCDHDRKQHNN